MYLAYTGYNIFDKWTHTPPPVVQQEKPSTKSYRVASMPTITSEIHDGNSRFADDVVVKLNAQENQLYYQEFYTAIMRNADNEPYFWSLNEQTFGKVVPKKAFLNPAGEYCRPFHEVISVHGEAQRSDEVLCQNGKTREWCRLTPTSTPSCSIGFSNSWERGMRAITNMGSWF